MYKTTLILPKDIRERESEDIVPASGPPSGHWSSGTAQRSASQRAAALTVSLYKLREAPSHRRASQKEADAL